MFLELMLTVLFDSQIFKSEKFMKRLEITKAK